MGGSSRVWRVCNFMTQTQPLSSIKKKIVTQPGGSGRVWRVGEFSAHPYLV